jgi:hypothetical protein
VPPLLVVLPPPVVPLTPEVLPVETPAPSKYGVDLPHALRSAIAPTVTARDLKIQLMSAKIPLDLDLRCAIVDRV